MFEYISGTLSSGSVEKVVVDVTGVGYCLYITLTTWEKLPKIGTSVKFFVSSVIREDSHKLYGFLRNEERDFFEMLNGISGIGPRLSIAILGYMSIDELFLSVEQANVKAISQIPGIGKKMAERLIIELKDENLKKKNFFLPSSTDHDLKSDAISALMHLGHSYSDAQKAVKKAYPSHEKEPSLSELISLALKTK